MRGLVLAAGLGSRLFPLTLGRAKPAVPFLNRPIIGYSLDLLAKAGVTEVAVNLHHLPDTVRKAVGEARGVRFSFEPEILGTGGAAANLRDFLGGDDFVVCNGKIYFEEDLTRIVAFHRETKALITLALVPTAGGEEFNPVYLASDSRVAGFGPAHRPAPDDRAFVFTGVHVMAPQVLDLIPEGPSDSVRDLYLRLVADKRRPIHGFVSDAYWCEISTPSRYLARSVEVLSRRGQLRLGDGLPPGSERVVAGPGCRVSGSASLASCVLWENVSVGDNVSLKNVVVADNISLPAGLRLVDSVVTARPASPEEVAARGGRHDGDNVIWPLM
jgi:mannose-1-phosphate guanylyltransferase